MIVSDYHFLVFFTHLENGLVWELTLGVWSWLVIVNLIILYLMLTIGYTLCREGNNSFIVMIVGFAGALAVCLNKSFHYVPDYASFWHATNFGDEIWNRVGGRENFYHCNKCGKYSSSCLNCVSFVALV